METWFEAVVRGEQMQDDGKMRKVAERYLVKSEGVSEAESIALKNAAEIMTGEVEVSAVSSRNIREVFNTTEGLFYCIKVGIVTIDEKTGREKLEKYLAIQGAASVRDALDKFESNMRGTLSDYVVHGVQLSSIVEVLNA